MCEKSFYTFPDTNQICWSIYNSRKLKPGRFHLIALCFDMFPIYGEIRGDIVMCDMYLYVFMECYGTWAR